MVLNTFSMNIQWLQNHTIDNYWFVGDSSVIAMTIVPDMLSAQTTYAKGGATSTYQRPCTDFSFYLHKCVMLHPIHTIPGC